MNADPLIPTAAPCDLETVIGTEQLHHRPARRADAVEEGHALLHLVHELSKSPQEFFQKLVETALALSDADSSGISLLDETRQRFIWPAVAGALQSYLGGGTPREFGPCGTVLDRNAAVLFLHPERHFTYLAPIQPPLEEVLLIPFRMDGKPVGTIWAVIHSKRRKFDDQDRRLLEDLSQFAASAYKVLATSGGLAPFLGSQFTPVSPPASASLASIG